MKHLKTLLLPAIAAVAPFMISSCDPKTAKGTLLDNVPNILTNVVGDSILQTWVKDSISVTSDFGHVGIAMQHPVDTFSVTLQAVSKMEAKGVLYQLIRLRLYPQNLIRVMPTQG